MTESGTSGEESDQSQVTRRDVAELQDFVNVTEVIGVHFLEVSGKRLQENRGPDWQPVFEMSVQHRVNDETFETRFRVAVNAQDADYVADVAVVFALAEPVEPAAAVIVEFVERIAVMAAYPFVREAVASSATRLSAEVPLLGFLRAGQFKLTPPDPADGDGETAVPEA